MWARFHAPSFLGPVEPWLEGWLCASLENTRQARKRRFPPLRGRFFTARRGAISASPLRVSTLTSPPLPQVSKLKHIFFLNEDSAQDRRLKLLSALRAAGSGSMGVPVTRVRAFGLHRDSEATNLTYTPESLHVLHSLPDCKTKLDQWANRTLLRDRRGRSSVPCTQQNPSCCLSTWWGGPMRDPFRLNPRHTRKLDFLQPQCCEHSDVYANSLGVFTRRACTGVLGTTLSRISLLQKLVSKHKAAKLDGLVLILEDDAHPKPAWDRRLEAFLARHPQGSWDVAKLHGPSTLDQRSPTCFGEAAVLLHTRRARDVLIQLQRDVVSNSDVRVCGGQNDREGERRLRVVVSEETIFAPLQKHELGYAPSTMDGSGHSECQVSGFI